MSGRAISLTNAQLIAVRESSSIGRPAMTYIPEYTKDGKKVNAKITIPVIANSKSSNGEGRKDSFKLVAWGKLADICARSISPGKAIDVITDIQSYLGNVFDDKGNLRLDVAGQPIQVTKVSFTIKDIVFGEEAEKYIEYEIQEGKRPANWDRKGHPDYQAWREKLIKKQSVVWDGKSATFGHARVLVPKGVQLNLQQPETPALAAQVADAVANQESMQDMMQKFMQQFMAGQAAGGSLPVVPTNTTNTNTAAAGGTIDFNPDDLF